MYTVYVNNAFRQIFSSHVKVHIGRTTTQSNENFKKGIGILNSQRISKSKKHSLDQLDKIFEAIFNRCHNI